MRKYEAVFVYPAGDVALTAGKSLVTEEFKNLDVRVVSEEDMHERELAYELKGATRGHYVLYNVEAEPDAISALDRTMKIRSEVLKFHCFRHEPRLRQSRNGRNQNA